MDYNNIIEIFDKADIKCTSVGEIDNLKISFLRKNCPELLEVLSSRTIMMWKDRIEHIKKHAYDSSNLSVEEMCKLIPEIIDKPDYLGVRKKDYGIQFIKRYNDNILVAAKIDSKGRLSLRTMYTITESQLQDYLRKGSAWEYKTEN